MDSTTTNPPLGLPRGVGQIFLQPNAVTGLLIVAGIAVFSLPMALLVLVGLLVSTAAGAALGRPADQGLEGYNGALVGAASWATLGHLGSGVLATVLAAAACPALAALLARVLGQWGRRALPVLTAPFCIASGLVALLAAHLHNPAGPALAVGGGGAGWRFLRAVLVGISQVVLVESWIGGLLILAGLAVAGWRIAAAGLLGSALGTLAQLALGTSLSTLGHGLWGYSPSLTAIACLTLLRRGAATWLLAAVGALVTVAVQAVLVHTGIPVYTWPFILTTWLLLALCSSRRA